MSQSWQKNKSFNFISLVSSAIIPVERHSMPLSAKQSLAPGYYSCVCLPPQRRRHAAAHALPFVKLPSERRVAIKLKSPSTNVSFAACLRWWMRGERRGSGSGLGVSEASFGPWRQGGASAEPSITISLQMGRHNSLTAAVVAGPKKSAESDSFLSSLRLKMWDLSLSLY